MPRLVDADALYQSFGASGNCNNCPLDAYKCQYYNEHTLMEFCERIEDAPTVDAEPVVRCKDCKWYKESKHSELRPIRFCYRLKNDDGVPVGYNWDDNDFCSYGERREDAKIN